MTGLRLPRIEGSPLVWGTAAAAVALAGGLAVAAAPGAAFDVTVIAAIGVLVARYPFPALIVILIARAAAPNSVAIGFITLGAGAVALVVAAPRMPAKRVVLPFIALLLIALASVPLLPSADEGPTFAPLRLPVLGVDYAAFPSLELLAWINLASVLVVFCLAGWTVTSRARLQTLVMAVLASGVVPLVVALKQLATGGTVVRSGSDLESLRGPFTFPNYFAFYLVVILLVATVVLIESRTLAVRLPVAVLLAAMLVCLFLTYTRSAWIGFAVALLALTLLRYRRLFVIAAVALLLAVLVVPGEADKAQQRFGDLTSKSEAADSNSWDWRVHQWRAMLPYGFDRPLTGQGWASYSRVTVREFGHFDRRYPTVQDPRRGVFSPLGFTAHNDYVRLFVEMGLPGLVLWIVVLVGLGVVSARARRVRGVAPVATAMLAVVLALILISFSDNLLGYTVVLMYAFAICGGLAGVTAASAGAASGRRVASDLAPAVESPVDAATPAPAPTPAAPTSPAEPTPAPPPVPRSAADRRRQRLRRWAARARRL